VDAVRAAAAGKAAAFVADAPEPDGADSAQDGQAAAPPVADESGDAGTQ
jgi:hypothetical protein